MDLMFVFIFGLSIGSFLLVLVERLPKEQPVFMSRSECDHCGHVLFPLDLIPVFSFVLLSGKCRYCHKKLSYKYPLMELLLGVSFVGIYLLSQSGLIVYPIVGGSFLPLFVLLAVVYSTLVVTFFTDLFDGIIPLYVALVGIIMTALYLFFADSAVLFMHVVTGFVTMLFFLAIFLGTKMRGIGFGDVIYGFYMGLFLGFPFIIVGLYIAFLTGAIVSIILVVSKKKRLKGDSVPFGPFLIFGTIVAFLFGEYLWNTARVYMGL